jgi:uncharacterized membrane protein YfcA
VTSSAGAAPLVKNGTANLRIGLRLETAAVIGATVAIRTESWVILLSFAIVMIYSAVRMLLGSECRSDDIGEGRFVCNDTGTNDGIEYSVRNVRTGMMGFMAAGISSALSGTGGGAIKVPVMNVHMHMPMKAATATSSFVVGTHGCGGVFLRRIDRYRDDRIRCHRCVHRF